MIICLLVCLSPQIQWNYFVLLVYYFKMAQQSAGGRDTRFLRDEIRQLEKQLEQKDRELEDMEKELDKEKKVNEQVRHIFFNEF